MRKVVGIPKSELRTAMMRALYGIDWRFALLWNVGVDTGLRISDILLFTGHTVTRFVREGSITIRQQKTKKTVTVTPSEAIIKELSDYARIHHIKGKEFVFWSRPANRGRAVTRQHVWRVFRAAGQSVDIARLGCHSMRRTFAQKTYKEYPSLTALQKRLGHRYISSTLTYLMEDDRLVFS